MVVNMEQEIDPQVARCMQILSVIGDLWTLAVVMTLQRSEMRFNELQRAIPRVNAVTLTSRLKKLEEAGIVSRAAGSRGSSRPSTPSPRPGKDCCRSSMRSGRSPSTSSALVTRHGVNGLRPDPRWGRLAEDQTEDTWPNR
jgi:hypothetical protein